MKERLFKWDDYINFRPEEGTKTMICETNITAGAVWCLEVGQEIPKHAHSGNDDWWVCLQGTGTFYPGGDEEVTITAGDIILSRPGEQHGMKNTGIGRFVCLGFAGPMPMDYIPM